MFLFCINVKLQDKVITTWEKIYVNQYYKFSDLKVGILQTSPGGKIFLLKTTETSTFSHINRLQIKEFHLVENLKILISFPGIDRLITSSTSFGSSLVSYQGLVTKLRNSEIGIYELDSKVLLYMTFNTGCIMLTVGSEIIISNAHLIKNDRGTPILVCCGLSCVKNSKPNDMSQFVPNNPHFVNFCIQYDLNIFDLLWFERLLSRFKKKFSSVIADEEILFQQNCSFLKNILEYFLCPENEATSKKFSLVEEFSSNPHRCFPFLESRLPTDCSVPCLSDILDGIVKKGSWIEAGARWEYCVGNQDNSVIIGILAISTHGNFYIADRTLNLPIILTEDCDDCCHDQSIIEKFKNSEFASVVAIQEYDIIVENIFCERGIQQSIQYIRTSFCRVYPLFSLCKSISNDFFTLHNSKCYSEKDAESIESNSDFHNNSQEINHRFLVLSKIWTFQSEVPCYSHILVLFLSENSQSEIHFDDENESISEGTFNFGDDAEFANLISELSVLHIEDKQVKLGYLYFDTTDQNNVFFPGHIYSIAPKDDSKKFQLTFEDIGERMFTWTITPDMKVAHDPICTGDHGMEDCEGAEYHGIKEILLKRHLNRNWIVTCILQDKMYEDVENINKGKANTTLCMIVKDVRSEECSIKAYVPHFVGSFCGLLPGASLQLCGFLCFGSQNRSLYLKASPTFGISVKQPKALSKGYRSTGLPNGDFLSGNNFHSPLQSICLVVRIMFAEIFLACSKCGRTFLKKCLCYSHQKIKVKLNVLIDDGNQVLSAHCDEEAAKKILNIDPSEWQSLVSYVEISHQSLKFSDKTSKSKIALLPIMNQVFNIYCSGKATSRKLMFKYIYVPKSYLNPAYVPSVWCKSVDDVDCQTHLQNLYLKLKNNGHNLSKQSQDFSLFDCFTNAKKMS
ncbi:uncharacterized protein LOC129964118 isoform X2 [Argiope bruennichi]|uniref:uncharacterized protein LOC129964118 isoform X2 n=1 Tax=Argiope bruennichi TaxID=94029 RepID=UPI002495A26C|nr:uncharacterized protein LOC129964118 isoform X2 [Argiope bruennichi]